MCSFLYKIIRYTVYFIQLVGVSLNHKFLSLLLIFTHLSSKKIPRFFTVCHEWGEVIMARSVGCKSGSELLIRIRTDPE